jgi:uncharacterized protein (TIGR03083 family)
VSSPSRPVTFLPKHDVLTALFASWDDLDHLLASLSDDDWHTPSPLPGWDVYDIVAHIVGTESILLGLPMPEVAGDLSELDHVRNDIGVLNESWVRELRGDTPAAMLGRFRDITGRRRVVLDGTSEEDWNTIGLTPAGQDTYGRFVRVRTFDCWTHEQDIRIAVDRPPSDTELQGPAAQLALDEVQASIAFVVGKLGKAPDGSRIAIELTGPLARTFRIAVVDGRATLVDEFTGGGPTTVIRLDGLQFTRLCGGRPMCSARSAAIDYEGDVGVGARIVEHLNYVI